MNNITSLEDYIKTKNFTFFVGRNSKSSIYNHMGATISDTVLQAGLNYRYVVSPRINNMLNEYGTFKTTSSFIALFCSIPLSDILIWKDNKKIDLIKKLSWLFFENGVENEESLKNWLCNNKNIEIISDIKGVGPKTIDYLKKLCGISTIPIDRHLFNFLELAKIEVSDYDEAKKLYEAVSISMGVEPSELDNKIWNYMSNSKSKQVVFQY